MEIYEASQVSTVQQKGIAEVNLVHDISQSAYACIVDDVCRLIGTPKGQIAGVIPGLPCESFSHADASNMSQGNQYCHYRDHSNPLKPPRSLASCTTQSHLEMRNKAIRDDNMCRNVLASYFADKKDGFSYELIIENPVGALRQRPYMRGEQVEEALKRTTIDY